MILIKNGLVYRKNQFKYLDVLIKDNKIIKIKSNIEYKNHYQLIDAKNKIVTPGFIDMHVHLREPGFSHKETIKSGTKAAAKGGFTTIAAMPNTSPVIDSVEIVNKVKKRLLDEAIVKVLLYSAITKKEQGLELVNFKAMSDTGVVGFSDDGKGVQSDSIMKEAMKCAKSFNKMVIAHCEDEHLSKDGVMHEGAISERLGIKGISSRSEYQQVKRDIKLAEMTNCQYHICHISTKESVVLVREAKTKGVNVSCEVTPHHLILCDDDVNIKNANYKMNPPLRSKDDQMALIEGLKDGTIDIIATDHAPHSQTEKKRGFIEAPFGIVGLETCFPLLYTHLVLKKIITLNQLIHHLTFRPAQLFGLKAGILEVGEDADITIVDLNQTFKIHTDKFFSKGKNSPFEGFTCNGLINLTMVNGHIVYKTKDG